MELDMKQGINRRHLLALAGALGVLPTLGRAASAPDAAVLRIGASWRGPKANDPHFAGVLAADWERQTLEVLYAVPLPTRPHGLLAEADGGLLVAGVRPGAWLLRCDGQGKVSRQINLSDDNSSVRLNGHAAARHDGRVIYTTETDYASGHGKIGVRDRQSLRKIDEWDSHGVEPHQLLLDQDGQLMVANGGVRRTITDQKYDLERMDSSLVRLDGRSGQLLRQWKLEDPRLSLRHLAWSHSPTRNRTYLGVAMQSEHADATQRAQAPVLAVLDGDELRIPTQKNDGFGYAGDIAGAYNGGFVLSSNKAGLAQAWFQGAPADLTAIVKLKEAYALASWDGPQPGGGVLVAAAAGLVRWHPTAPSAILPWPTPMALDNHWVLMAQA
jgi:hypothetical protein